VAKLCLGDLGSKAKFAYIMRVVFTQKGSDNTSKFLINVCVSIFLLQLDDLVANIFSSLNRHSDFDFDFDFLLHGIGK
jgi:hypothetical protein